MTSTDPFDFSDFGGPVPESAPSHRSAGPPPGRGGDGFDPFADHRPVPRFSADDAFAAFDDPAPSVRLLAVAGPPVALFAAAFGTALVGAALGVVAATRGSPVLLAFAGWLLAGPAAIGVLAWFNGVDTRRRLASVYAAPTWVHPAYWLVLATCAVGIALGAWQIALWAGRQ